jgi:IclR family mhp operon transcriptional activator
MPAYVFRDASDDRYRLTIMVRGLSAASTTRPGSPNRQAVIHELCREIVWPVSIATLSGTTMMMRETTDHLSPSGDRALFRRISRAAY